MDDAELARRAAEGDQGAWAAIYDTYADRLHDYCHSILRDRYEAADTLHDAFVTAATKIGQLRDPDRLRPWLYAICRTQALSAIRRRAREVPDEDVAAMTPASHDRSGYADAELRRLVADAAGGLEAKDRAVLDLHLRHGLEGKDLGEALGVSAHNATVQLGRVRTHVERSLAALLVGRTGRDDCAELDAILSGWDGSLSPLIRKRVARHIDRCEVCGERRRRMVSPLTLLGSLPMIPAPPELREPVLDDVALVSATRPLTGHAGSGARGWQIAAGFAGLLLLGGVLFGLQGPGLTPGQPSGVAAGPTGLAGPPTVTTVVLTTTAPQPAVATPPPAPTQAEQTTTAVTTGRPATTTTTPRDAAGPVISDLGTDRPWIAASDDECGTTVASATVTDESSFTVVLYWQQGADTSEQVPMVEREPSRYEATIGRVAAREGDVLWWIVATDEAGNTTRSDDHKLAVHPTCSNPS